MNNAGRNAVYRKRSSEAAAHESRICVQVAGCRTIKIYEAGKPAGTQGHTGSIPGKI